jgi:outer membrane biosynthesis protein TonB
MAAIALRSEERIGLVVAIAAHVALVAVLLLKPHAAPVVMPPDRIEVTIDDDVGLKSTSPEPLAEAAPDVAPEIGAPPPPEPVVPPPAPRVEPPRPEPPKPMAKPAVRPEPPKPAARPTTRPAPARRPSPRPVERSNLTPPPLPGMTSTREPARPGATRVGADFLKGVPGAQTRGAARNPPAQAAGPEVQASLLAAISRALRPHWQGKAPEGADAEKLVTVLRWNLNRDGSLAGRPQLVRQEGVTDANRPQAPRHAEQAIRAVELAAPFYLPVQYYDTWKRVTIRFDKRLSQ